MSLRRLLLHHLAPYRAKLLLVIVLQAVQTIATLVLPSLNADIIDEGVIPGDDGFIVTTGFVMLGFAALQIVFGAAAVWFGAQIAMGFGRDIRRDLFHTVTGYSAREVGRFGAPSLITRITNDVQQIQVLVVTIMTMMITAPMMLVFGVIMAVREDVGLSVVLVFAIPTAVIVLGSVVVRMVPAFQLMQIRVDRVNGVLREQITGMRVVRAFVREPEETARFEQANDELTETALRTGRLMAFVFPTITAIINTSVIGVLWIGAGRIDSGELQLGSLIAYISYLSQILIAVVMTTMMTSMVPRAAVAADRVDEVLRTPSSVVAPDEPVTELVEEGTLEFRDVGFSYDGAEHAVLSGIGFRIERGTTTAIIGSTGSGKSTLVDLVPRLFDVTEGAVLVGGVDVRRLDLDLLWSRIGYVSQKSYLFAGTVESNLRFGRPDATETELWEALEVAQAADFVRSMPGGLASEVKQGGANLSGGQRQRLAIARALVVRPEIYVFDDSFSALDLATDARLRAALVPFVREAAVLIVAQRVSTIAGAEEIIVLDDGRIIGKGTHDELVASCPAYAEIVESQRGVGALS